VSHYAETKIAAESEVLTMRTRDFHPTVLRIGTAFGLAPRPRFDLVVNLLAARAYFEGRAEIFNPERWRPFVHVSDIARAFDAVARAPIGVISGDTFNVGDSNMNLRMADLAIALTTCFPEARISEQSHPDRRNYRVSFDKIARTIGFRATVGVEQGIRELRAAFLSGEISDYRFPSYHNHHAPPSRAAIASTGAYETAASPAGR
jgi:nucleoside-diphosphate-sugar epimerase